MSPREPHTAAALPELPEPLVVERALPSGRSLVLRAGSTGEEIEIRSAGGDVELCITLTDAGPVVSMRGARVEVDSPDVAFKCRTFDVQASGGVRVQADEVRAETKHDIHLNGAFIRLNCTPEGEAQAQALLAQMAEQARAAGLDVPPVDACAGGHEPERGTP